MIEFPSMKTLYIALMLLLSPQLLANPRIAVIGAGLAGLTTAYRLREMGFDPHVYEARNRVGGRVFTIELQGHIAELGGQNIGDGGDAENLLNLAKDLGLEIESFNSFIQIDYFDDGQIFDISDRLKKCKFEPIALKSTLQQISENASSMKEVLQALFDEHDILYKACSAILSSYEGSSTEKLSSYYIDTLYHILLGGISTAHPNSQEENTEFQRLWIKGGNGRLTEKLAEPLNDRLHLQYVLQSIEKFSQGFYTLTFQNGEVIHCDILVLTIPCSVYENIAISNNVIDSAKQNDIKNVVYGTNAKILVPISPFLKKRGVQTNGRFFAYLNGDDHALNMHYIVNHGLFTAETIEKTFQQDHPLLSRFYSVLSDIPPVIARDQAFAFYQGPMGHSWPNDPFAKGSYSCIGPGQEVIFTATHEIEEECVKILFTPISNTLFFAGEHTCPFITIGGTMEAAVDSGERTARLIKKLSLRQNALIFR